MNFKTPFFALISSLIILASNANELSSSSPPRVLASSGDITLPANSKALTSALTLYYDLTSTTITVAIKCTVPNVAFNIGWGSRSMTNSDIWTFEISGNTVTASDRWSTGEVTPALDTSSGGVDSLTLLGYEITDTYTTVKVSRLLNTGDSRDNVIVNGTNQMTWAYRAGSTTLAQHNSNTRGAVDFNFWGTNDAGILKTAFVLILGVLMLVVLN